MKEKKSIPVYWVVMLIISCIILLFNVNNYIQYKEMKIINNTLINIFWMETTILNIIRSLRGLEIRENGIYNSGYLYKWTKIQSYSWIISNKIQLEVNSIFGVNSFEINIKEEFKLKVEEIIKRKLDV
jgi:hypothetical protein